MTDYLYDKKVTCPLCEREFTTKKVTMSQLSLKRRHDDFYMEYEQMNPNLYYVWVCPHCAYAAPERDFDDSDLLPAEKKRIRELLDGRVPRLELAGERTREQADAAMKLALLTASRRNNAEGRLGVLFLRLAWLWRGEDEAQEQAMTEKAFEHLEKAYMTEPEPPGNMNKFAFTYLVGELARRCGNDRKAGQYWSQLMQKDRHDEKVEPWLEQLVREKWQAMRQDRRASGSNEKTEASGKGTARAEAGKEKAGKTKGRTAKTKA